MRSNPDFFKAHRQERSKGGYVYDEEVLKNLKNHFMVFDVVPDGEENGEKKENPDINAPILEENGRLLAEIAALTAELEAERAKNQALQADFEKVEGERVELLRQNGLKTDEINHLLLLLSQEKAEKQALLPPPRRSIGQTIKNIFKKKDKG